MKKCNDYLKNPKGLQKYADIYITREKQEARK